MSTSSLTLEQVLTAFQQYRQQPDREQHIPNRLRQQALSLLSHYPRNQVVRTLGINYKMLTAWEEKLLTSDSDAEPSETSPTRPNPAMSFITLPPIEGSMLSQPTSQPEKAQPNTETIRLHLPNGLDLYFDGHLASQQCINLLIGLDQAGLTPRINTQEVL